MSGGDTLASVGEKVTDLFVNAFASGNAGASLVFLPFALTVPDDIAQGGIVNPTCMTAFLAPNFDAPYLVSATQYAVHGKDLYYGSASQIYSIAVNSARPVAAVGTDAWKQVNSEIAAAQSGLNPSGVAIFMTCTPDDWVLPQNGDYWSTFDSSQSQGPPASAPAAPAGSGGAKAPLRAMVNPAVWALKPAAAASLPVSSLTTLHGLMPAIVRPAIACPPLSAAPIADVAPVRESTLVGLSEAPIHIQNDPVELRRIPIDIPPLHWPHPSPVPTAPPDPPPSSSMSVHFDYMSVTIGFTDAGVSVWNGAFLADQNWCVPGLPKGGLLPAPALAAASGGDPLSYGLPIALIVVRNLAIAVKWSGQEQAVLGNSGGFLGPFSLSGASAANAPDGSIIYSRPGMQVIGLLCSRLPVLPPADAPDAAQTASATAGAAAPTQPAAPASEPAVGGSGSNGSS